MIGGDRDAVARLEPIFRTLAPGRGDDRRARRAARRHGGTAEEGYLHCGPAGAGHFVKMVHNGIEYGLMQAYAEGFDILRGAATRTSPAKDHRYDLDLADIAEVWRRGSVVALVAARSDGDRRSPRARRSTEFTGVVSRTRARAAGRSQAAIEEAVPGRRARGGARSRASARARSTRSPRRCCRRCASKFGGHTRTKSDGAVRRRWPDGADEAAPRHAVGDRPPVVAAPPCVMVIFGAAGDLTKRKLIPALYNLRRDGLLPDAVRGRRRRARADDRRGVPRASCATTCSEFSSRALDPTSCGWLDARISCPASFERRSTTCQRSRRRCGRRSIASSAPRGNALFYLATPPDAVRAGSPAAWAPPACDGHRRTSEPAGGASSSRSRSATTSPSARALNQRAAPRCFDEQPDLPHRSLPRQGDRAEHHGLPLRQRHLRADLEPPLRRPRADHRGRDGRRRRPRRLLRHGRRAARHGAEPPVPAAGADRDGAADLVRAPTRCATRRSKVLRAIQPLDAEEVLARRAVRGQYARRRDRRQARARLPRGAARRARLAHRDLRRAASCSIDNWRWAGVPFYLRTGKRLRAARRPRSRSSSSSPPLLLFRETPVRRPRRRTCS